MCSFFKIRVLFLLITGLLFSLYSEAKESYYANLSYESTTHRLGAFYGNFQATGYLIGAGKRINSFGFEGFYGKNSSLENKILYNRNYAITLDESYYGAGMRIFFLKNFNVLWGLANHKRVIVVPPGCPLQTDLVLDDQCTGPILGAGVVFPFSKIDLHAEYKLDRGCQQKRVIEAGIRGYF